MFYSKQHFNENVSAQFVTYKVVIHSKTPQKNEMKTKKFKISVCNLNQSILMESTCTCGGHVGNSNLYPLMAAMKGLPLKPALE